MIVKLAISANREAVHATLIQLLAIGRTTGALICNEGEGQDLVKSEPLTAADKQIRGIAAANGQGRFR